MPLILDTPSESSVDTEPDLVEERRRLHHDADVVIVGAGILGSALAFALGEQGRSVMLLEKSLKEPDRIVGELLQPGGVQALEELGLRHCLEDIDCYQKSNGYGVSYYNQLVHIPYPANVVDQPSTKSEKEDPPLKAEGRSFHHGRFVSKLRAAAMKHPNVTVFETEVTGIVESEFTAQVIGVSVHDQEKPSSTISLRTLQSSAMAMLASFARRIHHILLSPSQSSGVWNSSIVRSPIRTMDSSA